MEVSSYVIHGIQHKYVFLVAYEGCTLTFNANSCQATANGPNDQSLLKSIIVICDMICNAYSTLRTAFYHQSSSVMLIFIDNNDADKLKLLMNKEHVTLFNRYICDIYKIRQDILFKENVWQMCTP